LRGLAIWLSGGFALTVPVLRVIIRPSRIVAQLSATFTMADYEFAALQFENLLFEPMAALPFEKHRKRETR
jgi:hypothetical protein